MCTSVGPRLFVSVYMISPLNTFFLGKNPQPAFWCNFKNIFFYQILPFSAFWCKKHCNTYFDQRLVRSTQRLVEIYNTRKRFWSRLWRKSQFTRSYFEFAETKNCTAQSWFCKTGIFIRNILTFWKAKCIWKPSKMWHSINFSASSSYAQFANY